MVLHLWEGGEESRGGELLLGAWRGQPCGRGARARGAREGRVEAGMAPGGREGPKEAARGRGRPGNSEGTHHLRRAREPDAARESLSLAIYHLGAAGLRARAGSGASGNSSSAPSKL